MTEDLTAKIENTAGTDEIVGSSTTTAIDANTESTAKPETGEAAKVDAEVSAAESTETKPKRDRYQPRINQLTKEKREAQQENADLKARLEKLEAAQVKPEVSSLVAPKEDEFESHEEFQSKRDQSIADRAGQAAYERLQTENANRDRDTQKTERQKELEAKKGVFESRITEERGKYLDFEENVYGADFGMFLDEDLAEQIFDNPKSIEVAYHLSTNLDEAARVFALTPIQRARELTKLELQLEAPAAKVVSGAPDPIVPLGNAEVTAVDPDGMDNDAWLAWRRKQLNG